MLGNVKKMHDIVCSSCGAHDMVPFRPRPGSAVMCRTCYGKEQPAQTRRPNNFRSRGRGHGGLPVVGERKTERETWSITCTECGCEDNVPFKPRPGSEVFCRGCHEKQKERRQLRERYGARRGSNRGSGGGRRAVHIPRLDHGTRVSYPITCESCGKNETLSYVPNTSGPVLCTDCATTKYGRKWYQVEFGSEASREEHTITCVECGCEDTVPFEPKPDRKYHCRRCMDGQAQPNRSRLKEFKDVGKSFVKVRRS